MCANFFTQLSKLSKSQEETDERILELQAKAEQLETLQAKVGHQSPPPPPLLFLPLSFTLRFPSERPAGRGGIILHAADSCTTIQVFYFINCRSDKY